MSNYTGDQVYKLRLIKDNQLHWTPFGLVGGGSQLHRRSVLEDCVIVIFILGVRLGYVHFYTHKIISFSEIHDEESTMFV